VKSVFERVENDGRQRDHGKHREEADHDRDGQYERPSGDFAEENITASVWQTQQEFARAGLALASDGFVGEYQRRDGDEDADWGREKAHQAEGGQFLDVAGDRWDVRIERRKEHGEQ
jgi:hypothetical protein